MNKGTVITIVFLVVLGYFSVSLILTGNKYQCEVCVKYKGRESCQEVKGMDKETTIMTGMSTACGAVANGRTETIDCNQTPPTKMICKDI